MSAKILVVDDDLESLKLIGMILQAKGYQIVAARDGQQALERAFQEAPDLVILDVMMPGMDGYAVCQRLRADPRTSTIPIVMFTAKGQLADKVIGLQSGADEYLTKPIHPRELIAHVEALLARAARFHATARPSLRAKVIGFLGCKGGVGTSTLAVNVSVALARGPAQGKKVALLEFRPGMSTLALQLGLPLRDNLQRLVEQPIGSLNAETILAQMERHPTGVMVLGGTPVPLGTVKPIPPLHADAITRHLGAVVDYILIGLVTAILIAILAITAPWIAPYDPLVQDVYTRLAPPSPDHLLGQDDFGRDVLSRIIWGARVSLLVGICSVAFGGLLGTVLGVLAGYKGGRIEIAI
ncbi:MAG TPA: response regulator, partial [Anaerolineae bacterium]|nr:response regulator [Anaerolineae bacterium]